MDYICSRPDITACRMLAKESRKMYRWLIWCLIVTKIQNDNSMSKLNPSGDSRIQSRMKCSQAVKSSAGSLFQEVESGRP